jgi:hypothetical protein
MPRDGGAEDIPTDLGAIFRYQNDAKIWCPQSFGGSDTFITSSAIRSVITSVSLSVSFVVVSVIRVPMCRDCVHAYAIAHVSRLSPPTRYREG